MNDEEELQRALLNGQVTSGDSTDVRAYREVFRALGRDTGYKLPDDFSERVAARVLSKQKSSDIQDYLWFLAGILFLAMASIGTILYTGFRFQLGFLNEMADYKGLAIFGIAFIMFLNWLDRRIVRHERINESQTLV